MTLFDRLFNQQYGVLSCPAPPTTRFMTRDDMEYVLELAEAYSEPNDYYLVQIRSVLEEIDKGCSTLNALAAVFNVTPPMVRNRVAKSWFIACKRARSAVLAAELGRGFTPAPRAIHCNGLRRHQIYVDGRLHRDCANWAVAKAWLEGFNYAQLHGIHHNVMAAS